MLTTRNTNRRPGLTIASLGLAALLAACTPPGPRALLDGERLLQEGRPEDAIPRLRTAVELLPGNAQAWNHLGLAHHTARQPREAADAYGQALRVDRNLAVAHFNLGCLWFENGDPNRALDSLRTHVGLAPQSQEGWLRLGQAQLRLRQWDLADRSFGSVLKLAPRNAEALNGLGIALQQRRRNREAWQCFTNALGQNPQFAPAWLNLAVIAHQAGARPQAIHAYRQYANLRPDNARSLGIPNLLQQLEPPTQPVFQLPPASQTNPAAPAAPATPATAQPPQTGPRTNPPTAAVTPGTPTPTNAPAQPRSPPRRAEVERPGSPTNAAPPLTASTPTSPGSDRPTTPARTLAATTSPVPPAPATNTTTPPAPTIASQEGRPAPAIPTEPAASASLVTADLTPVPIPTPEAPSPASVDLAATAAPGSSSHPGTPGSPAPEPKPKPETAGGGQGPAPVLVPITTSVTSPVTRIQPAPATAAATPPITPTAAIGTSRETNEIPPIPPQIAFEVVELSPPEAIATDLRDDPLAPATPETKPIEIASLTSPGAAKPATNTSLVRPVSAQKNTEPAEKRGFWDRANPTKWFGPEKDPKIDPAPKPAENSDENPNRWRWANPAAWFKSEESKAEDPTNLVSAVRVEPSLPTPPPKPQGPGATNSPKTASTPAPTNSSTSPIRAPEPTKTPAPVRLASRSEPAPAAVRRYDYQRPQAPTAGDAIAASPLVSEAVREHTQGRLDNAVRLYGEAVRIDPGSFEAQQNLATALLQSGEASKALPVAETALALRPGSTTARLNFALALDSAGYPADAVAEALRVTSGGPGPTTANQTERVAAHLLLGNLYAQKLSQPDRAKEHYLRVLELEPEHPQNVAIRRWLVGRK